MFARILASLLWLLPTISTLFAQMPQYEAITIENGLSQGMIFDIVQTRDGFIWVATKDALNRYDGYNFKAAWAGQLPNEPDLSCLTQATCFSIEPSKPVEDDMEEYLIAINAEPGGDLRVFSNLRAYALDPEQALLRPIAAGKANDPWLSFPFRLLRFLDGQADLPEFPCTTRKCLYSPTHRPM